MPTVSSIQEVRNHIRALPSMVALKPDDYAERGGLADVVVRESSDLKATQLRKVFHYVKDLRRQFQKGEAKFERGKVSLMMPLLAYARGREHIPNEFYELLVLCFGQDKCKTADDFESAVNFLEAIMAYHKYYNPKGS
jgi:CRISPR-associated protein Csm2